MNVQAFLLEDSWVDRNVVISTFVMISAQVPLLKTLMITTTHPEVLNPKPYTLHPKS